MSLTGQLRKKEKKRCEERGRSTDLWENTKPPLHPFQKKKAFHCQGTLLHQSLPTSTRRPRGRTADERQLRTKSPRRAAHNRTPGGRARKELPPSLSYFTFLSIAKLSPFFSPTPSLALFIRRDTLRRSSFWHSI